MFFPILIFPLKVASAPFGEQFFNNVWCSYAKINFNWKKITMSGKSLGKPYYFLNSFLSPTLPYFNDAWC